MMLAVIFAQAAVKTDRKQRWMVCKLMSDSGADDGKVNFIFNQGSNAKTTNPLINCWTHNKMDKLKRLFFLSELASFRTTCSSLWLMLLSNCHNSLYKGENLLAIDYLLRAVRRFTLSGFSPEGVLTRVYTEQGLCALWEIFKVGHFEGLAIERGKSPQRGLKCFLQGSFTSHPHLSPGNDTAGLRLRFWKWQPSLRKLFDAGKITDGQLK